MDEDIATTQTLFKNQYVPTTHVATIAAICTLSFLGSVNDSQYLGNNTYPIVNNVPEAVATNLYSVLDDKTCLMTAISPMNALEISGPMIANTTMGLERFIGVTTEYIRKAVFIPGDEDADRIVDAYYAEKPLKISRLVPPRPRNVV